MRRRVLVPRGRALETFLRLRNWDDARRRLRELATEPRPSWAREVACGWRIDLDAGEWLLYQVDDQQVTVVLCHAA